jgi:hypothetical protein
VEVAEWKNDEEWCQVRGQINVDLAKLEEEAENE